MGGLTVVRNFGIPCCRTIQTLFFVYKNMRLKIRVKNKREIKGKLWTSQPRLVLTKKSMVLSSLIRRLYFTEMYTGLIDLARFRAFVFGVLGYFHQILDYWITGTHQPMIWPLSSRSASFFDLQPVMIAAGNHKNESGENPESGTFITMLGFPEIH